MIAYRSGNLVNMRSAPIRPPTPAHQTTPGYQIERHEAPMRNDNAGRQVQRTAEDAMLPNPGHGKPILGIATWLPLHPEFLRPKRSSEGAGPVRDVQRASVVRHGVGDARLVPHDDRMGCRRHGIGPSPQQEHRSWQAEPAGARTEQAESHVRAYDRDGAPVD